MSIIPEEIERVAALGWHVYPASKVSKAGMFAEATEAATCDLSIIEGWVKRFPSCNWRVVMGASHLFALDVDKPGTHAADGFAALVALVAHHGPLPPRPMTRTGGSGGAALFFRHGSETLRGQSGCPAAGLDPHRGRQAVMIPPSRHSVTGGAYTWRTAPWELAPPAIPPWLAGLLAPPPRAPAPPYTMTDERARKALYAAVDHVRTGGAGGRNDTLNRNAFKLAKLVADGKLYRQVVEGALLDAALEVGLDRKEAEDTIKSAFRAGRRG
jgi:hypothetical protein